MERKGTSTRISIPGGTIEMSIERGVHLTRYYGRMRNSMIQPFVEALERDTAAGPRETFNDAYELAGYEPGFRTALTEWVAQNRARVPRTHVLVKSKIAAMAATVASLVVGGHRLLVYSTRVEFEAAMAAARK